MFCVDKVQGQARGEVGMNGEIKLTVVSEVMWDHNSLGATMSLQKEWNILALNSNTINIIIFWCTVY